MKKTEYAHHVIEKYIAVSAACTFAIENYRQQTAEDANQVLREQFNASMKEYEAIYGSVQKSVPSIEHMVDFKTVSNLQVLAERNAARFLEELKLSLPPTVALKFDFLGAWDRALKEGQNQIPQAIYYLIKELREFEEQEL